MGEAATGDTKSDSLDAPQLERLDSFNQHRPLLFAIAYRMLASYADAEDILQETFIRWQRISIPDLNSRRPLLVTILTRLAINHLQSARVRREEYFGQWLPEPLLTAPLQNPSIVLTNLLRCG